MRSQHHQELKYSKSKPSEKNSQHKKSKTSQILHKYKSLFHQKRILKKEFNYLNRQNYISSIDLNELPKTLQAYYSVFDNSRNTSSNSSSINVPHSPSASAIKHNGNIIEDFSLNERQNSKCKGLCKTQSSPKEFQRGQSKIPHCTCANKNEQRSE